MMNLVLQHCVPGCWRHWQWSAPRSSWWDRSVRGRKRRSSRTRKQRPARRSPPVSRQTGRSACCSPSRRPWRCRSRCSRRRRVTSPGSPLPRLRCAPWSACSDGPSSVPSNSLSRRERRGPSCGPSGASSSSGWQVPPGRPSTSLSPDASIRIDRIRIGGRLTQHDVYRSAASLANRPNGIPSRPARLLRTPATRRLLCFSQSHVPASSRKGASTHATPT